MKVFRVAVDSSCLIGLAQIEIFGLLKEVFAEIYIPRAVYEEVVPHSSNIAEGIPPPANQLFAHTVITLIQPSQ